MNYEANNYTHLLGLEGFSDDLLNNHFKLYEGYVNRTNKVANRLREMAQGKMFGAGEYAELKRRFGWEFNGMRLHEYYFGNLTKEENFLSEHADLRMQILKDFGSLDAFITEFTSTGAIPGIGWVVLYFDVQERKLFNVWINEHDTGHLSGAVPLLVMDVFEHAFMLDYGLAKAEYIAAFTKAINWEEVVKRFNTAL